MNEEKQENNPISSLHTLEGDLLASMKDENYGSNIVKIVTQGNNGKNTSEEKRSSNNGGSKAKIYIIIAVLVLIGIGAGLFYTVYLPAKKEASKNTTASSTDSSLPSNIATTTQRVQSKNIFEADIVMPMIISDGNKNDFIKKISEAQNELLKNLVGDKLNISFLLDANLDDLFNKLQYSGKENLLRSLSLDQAYNFGVYHVKGTEFEKYFLVKIEIFDLGFSGMLEWERTMPIDLERIFTYTNPTSSSTSTKATTTKNLTPKFVDKVIKNIDVRTYTDPEKGTQITYGFINRQYLLITSGENSFADILNKLLINNVLR